MGVRRAVLDDAEAIATVHVRSWQAGYRGQLPDAVLDALEPAHRLPRWAAVLAATSWPARGTLVAVDGTDRVLGFANLTPTRDDDQDPALVGEITSFYVAPAVWRRGSGRELMAASLAALAVGYRTGTLWVLDTNSQAMRFYEATGWRADGLIKGSDMAGAPVREVRYLHDLRITRGPDTGG